MSLKNRLSEILGAEDHDADVVAVIPAEEQAIVLADGEVAVAETVVAEHEQEITEIQNDIETIEERLEDVEENVAGLEAMISGEAEWNPALAMKLYNDARKLTARSFGESNKSPVIDGVESFADATTAQLTIVEGLEDIKEKAGNAATAVANFFKNLYKSIIAAFVGLFDRLKGIENRSEAIIKRINATPEDKIKKEITLGAWNAYLDVDKNTNVINKIGNIVGVVKELGGALNASKGESALSIVNNVLDKFGGLVDGKRQAKTEGGDRFIGRIAHIEFSWVVPKTLEKLRTASLQYKVAEGGKTSGTVNSSISNKTGLVNLARSIKGHAGSAREAKFSASSLNTARDKAINLVKSLAATGDTRKEAQAVRAAHSVSNNIARSLTRYEGDVLIAGQKYITAHL